jgi:arsenite methyltransferase
MKTNLDLKEIVKSKYSEIALQDKAINAASCCGAGSCSTEVYNIMTDDYTGMQGYNPDADLALGCGLPTQYAGIKPGDVVLDLGSGAGNDCFVARHETGDSGKVIGVDFTPAMIEKARSNAEKLGYTNVEFREGDIENLPVDEASIDVIVSNCVLNLVPDKEKAFAEMFRVLKPGGHFSVSDVVLKGELPVALKSAAEMYAGCVSGAIQKDKYLNHIFMAGFQKLSIQKEKEIVLPNDILSDYLTPSEIESYRQSGNGIYSVTVYAEKAGECCAPGCGCK